LIEDKKMLRDKSLDQTTFFRLRRLYIVALSIIALSLIISQFLIQIHLNKQLNDSRIVNLAGRQRMLSQKLTKQLLLLVYNQPNNQKEVLSDIQTDRNLWTQSYRGLIHGAPELGIRSINNSEEVKQMFDALELPYQMMLQSIDRVIANADDSLSLDETVESEIPGILENEKQFLAQMDEIVFQYDREAKDKVSILKRTEYILLTLAILVLVFELIFVFRPAAENTRKIISDLIHAEKEAKQLTEEMKSLYEQKENSLRELRALNFAVDQAALFASTTVNGEINYLSEKFCQLLGFDKERVKGQFVELLNASENDKAYIKSIFKEAGNRVYHREIEIVNQQEDRIWLEISIVPVNRSGLKKDFLILCSDISARKNALKENDRLKELRFAEEISQQKILSAKVLEAEEQERKRIAREMHDGIGQMLTALKFNIQSINHSDEQMIKVKLQEVNDLVVNLIKGVRIATFNLTPPELTDYGIASALGKMAQELQKLTGKTIQFQKKAEYDIRLDSIVESNLYRIVQEAVNNALKYAQAENILISLTQTSDMLSIVVDDDGKGFDKVKLKKQIAKDSGTGMGMTFMQERVNFIHGRLFVTSQPGKGTRITINLPLKGITSPGKLVT